MTKNQVISEISLAIVPANILLVSANIFLQKNPLDDHMLKRPKVTEKPMQRKKIVVKVLSLPIIGGHVPGMPPKVYAYGSRSNYVL